MSENNSSPETVSADTDDLDAFNDLLHGRAKETEIETNVEEEIPEDAEETDTLATEDEETSDESDETETEDEESEEEAKEEPKKKNRFQERISELNTKYREAERREQDLQRKLDEVLAKLDNQVKPEAAKPVQETDGPAPTDQNEDGTDKYPLGEFDPNYIRDLTRYTLKVEAERVKEETERQRQIDESQKAQLALATEWSAKLDKAVETKYPDMREKNQNLQDTFADMDPAYGDYLATTIMSMEYGDDVLYHLATHIDEAKRIAASGPAKATIALGRLEARFALQNEEQKEKKLKVSNAPPPPTRLNKGSSVAKVIAGDTDDLDAFEQSFFVKRNRR